MQQSCPKEAHSQTLSLGTRMGKLRISTTQDLGAKRSLECLHSRSSKKIYFNPFTPRPRRTPRALRCAQDIVWDGDTYPNRSRSDEVQSFWTQLRS